MCHPQGCISSLQHSRLGKVAISNLSIRVVRAIDAESACGAQALARRLAVPAVVSLVNRPSNLSVTHLKLLQMYASVAEQFHGSLCKSNAVVKVDGRPDATLLTSAVGQTASIWSWDIAAFEAVL